jgi:hypothetical protein
MKGADGLAAPVPGLVNGLDRTWTACLEFSKLAANAKTLNQGLVTLWAAVLQVVEQFAPPGHHAQQPSPRVVILLMRFEMLGQLQNTLTQEGNLNLWRAGIRFVDPVLTNRLGFLLYSQGHARRKMLLVLP